MKKIDICVGTDRQRNIRVRLSLMYLDDTTQELISEQYHSGVIHPGDDPELLRTNFNNHLNQVGGIPGAPWGQIPTKEWGEVLSVVATLHTKERKDAYLVAKQAELNLL